MPKCPECQVEMPAGAKFCSNCGTAVPAAETAPGSSMNVSGNVLNRSSLDASQTQAKINVNIGAAGERPLRPEDLVHCKVCGRLLAMPEWRCPECESYVCEQHYLPEEFMCLRCFRKREAAVVPEPAEVPTVPGPPEPELAPWEREGTRLGEEIIGPDGGAMVWVPPGEFMMGSSDGDRDEKPVHRVRITKGFWLAKHPVTNAQYFDFCAAAGRSFPEESNQGDDHPVVHVSWEDAKAYCQHHSLRLPTETEWEYAARGPEAWKYPWGEEWDSGRCRNYENSSPSERTSSVGSFPLGASWCGTLDMAGNVWEWCCDWYDAGYYNKSAAADPAGPGYGEYRVLRGGAWSYGSYSCRSAARVGLNPVFRVDNLGFRCCVSLK